MNQKQRYRIRNWRDYNRALVQRGSLTLWFTDEAVEQWYHHGRNGRRGRDCTYSDGAIQCLLVIKQVFHLPLRAMSGLAGSLVQLLGPTARDFAGPSSDATVPFDKTALTSYSYLGREGLRDMAVAEAVAHTAPFLVSARLLSVIALVHAVDPEVARAPVGLRRAVLTDGYPGRTRLGHCCRRAR